MEKTITFNIPDGYVIDKENSTDTNIVLKLAESTRVRTYEEYCEKMEEKDSYYFDGWSIRHSQFDSRPIVGEFNNKEDAIAFAAYSQLLKFRKDWIGEWKPNWANNYQKKYVICNYSGIVTKDTMITASHCLSFPTQEMCDEFFDCFKYYLEQAKDLI